MQLRIGILVEGADAVKRVVDFRGVGEADVELTGIDQRDHRAGA
jgi:hypothetical protein